jgi:hypothetical protein
MWTAMHGQRANRYRLVTPFCTALPKLGPSQMAAFFRRHDAL